MRKRTKHIIYYAISGALLALLIWAIAVPAIECVTTGGYYVKAVPWYYCSK